MKTRLMTLATMLVLLTAFAPLVLAQQNTSETPPAETPPAEPPPAEAAPPPFELVLEDPFSLNENSDLVLDCDAVFRNLALLNTYRDTTLVSNPQYQASLAETEDLSQICVDAGLASFGQVSDDSEESADVEQYEVTDDTGDL